MPPRKPDEPRRGDPQWGAGGAATIADSATFGFGPEVLHWLTGVPEDEVRADIDAFGEEHPVESNVITWGPIAAGGVGLARGVGRKVLGRASNFVRGSLEGEAARTARRGAATSRAAAKPPLDPKEIKAQELARKALKDEPVSGLPASVKSDVRDDILRAVDLPGGPPIQSTRIRIPRRISDVMDEVERLEARLPGRMPEIAEFVPGVAVAGALTADAAGFGPKLPSRARSPQKAQVSRKRPRE